MIGWGDRQGSGKILHLVYIEPFSLASFFLIGFKNAFLDVFGQMLVGFKPQYFGGFFLPN
jgi:hypothetical protein